MSLPRRLTALRALLVVLLAGVVVASVPLGAPPAAAEGAEGRWSWPLPPPTRVLAPADLPAERWLPGHRGLDLTGGGPSVSAVAHGTVLFAGPVAGRPVVSVAHGDGLVSSYEPVAPSVVAGQRVARGSALGTLAAPGAGAAASHCAPAVCLHLGARRHDVYVDPMPLLSPPRPSVLKPWAGLPSDGAPALRGGASGPRVGLVEARPQPLW